MADDLDAAKTVDAELVQAARAGNRAAFTELVKRYQNTVSAVTFAQTRRMSLSEDAAQETFILAWSRLNELRNPDAFRSWLIAIARRAGLRALRSQKPGDGDRDVSVRQTDVPSSEPSPLDRVITHEEEEVVWSAVRNISEPYRMPLVLFYREQQSLKKVARMLKLSPTNVRMRLVRGRRILRADRLGDAMPHDHHGLSLRPGLIKGG